MDRTCSHRRLKVQCLRWFDSAGIDLNGHREYTLYVVNTYVSYNQHTDSIPRQVVRCIRWSHQQHQYTTDILYYGLKALDQTCLSQF